MEKETQAQIDTTVRDVFRCIFDSQDLVISRATTANDIEGWDSLANIQMIVAIEKAFSIRFTITEIVQLQNVGDLADLVKSRIGQ